MQRKQGDVIGALRALIASAAEVKSMKRNRDLKVLIRLFDLEGKTGRAVKTTPRVHR